jgi:hypothetical protein
MGQMDCMFRELPVRLSESARYHLDFEDISPETLCDMVNHPIDCPRGTPRGHRKESVRICAERRGNIYVIFLEKSYTVDLEQDSYLVKHLKPI